MTKKPPAERLVRLPSEHTPREKMLIAFEKACLVAAEEREANKELRQEYRNNRQKREKVQKLLIEDLIRVFNHEDNPYEGWAASRDRYRQLGHFPEVMVADLFGTHAQFERESGLRDQRGTSKVLNATAKLATEKTIREYAEETVMGSVGRWSKRYRGGQGVKVLAVSSDWHGAMCDPFARRVYFTIVDKVQPDGQVFNGDVVDFPTVGRYSQIPGASALSLQDEIDYVKDNIFATARKVAPKSWITYHIGNHEHRLVRYLADTAPQLADLRALRWDNLFGINEHGIEMVFGGNWLAPRQADVEQNLRKTYKVYYDALVATHGHSIAKNAMEVELRRFGMSGTSGHTHRPGTWTQPTMAAPHLSWTSTGMMAGFAVGKDYVDGPSGWTMGFSIFTIDTANGIVVPQPVLIYEDFATFAGHVFRPTEEERATRRRLWGEGGCVTASKRNSP